ncbi:MAG: hypothetical protein HY364_03355 [Candidatus Aenigmarchaeota archaeon]|nr:hypothetical protein [Candidatus Aenigmarchaeota archaeon]
MEARIRLRELNPVPKGWKPIATVRVPYGCTDFTDECMQIARNRGYELPVAFGIRISHSIPRPYADEPDQKIVQFYAL